MSYELCTGQNILEFGLTGNTFTQHLVRKDSLYMQQMFNLFIAANLWSESFVVIRKCLARRV